MSDLEHARPRIENEGTFSSNGSQQVGNVITAGRDIYVGSHVSARERHANNVLLHSKRTSPPHLSCTNVVEGEEGKKILGWLSDLNFQQRCHKYLYSHQAGTGRWFLETSQYISWRDDPSSSLWLKGMRKSSRDHTDQRV